jgi:hypothetical protein
MTSENLTKEEKKDLPAFKIKVGSIDVALWSHELENGGYFFKVSYNKSYLDENNAWQKTNNLHVNDIPNLQIALQKAYEHAKIKNQG